MEIKYRGHTKRTAEAKLKWKNIVEDYNNGASIEELREKYKNPRTGKKSTAPYIYWALKKASNL